MARDTITFLRELPKNWADIGAVIPSSRHLAKSMARPIERASKPMRILEVGPGTGPITRRILKIMGAQDHLTICELNAVFLQQLQTRLAKNRDFLRNKDRVQFHQGPVQDLRGQGFDGYFDVIVSSLPFTNFTPDLVEDILSLYRDLLTEDGSLTFVEYAGIRKIKSLLLTPEERERAKGVDEVIARWKDLWKQNGTIKKDFTLLNFPPAITHEFNHRIPKKKAVRR